MKRYRNTFLDTDNVREIPTEDETVEETVEDFAEEAVVETEETAEMEVVTE